MPAFANDGSAVAEARGSICDGVWERGSASSFKAPPLREHVSADCIVVGGGVAGISAAFHLAEMGAAVRVLEAEQIGSGAVGRSSGFVNPGLWAHPSVVLKSLGIERGERLLQLLGDAPGEVFHLVERLSISCGLQQFGTLQCADSTRGLAAVYSLADEWAARGAKLRKLDSAETAALVGTPAYIGAVLDYRGGTLNPLSYVRGLAQAGIDEHARIHCCSPARSIEQTSRGWRVVTPAGSVTAPWVVVATDSYSLPPWRSLRDEQILLPFFNIATRPLDLEAARSILPGRAGLVDAGRVMSAIRLDASGRLVFGSVGALRGPGARIHRRWVMRRLHSLFRELKCVEIDAASWGMIGLTTDGIPRFHQLAPQVLSISGYNGRGIAAATVFGKLIAEAISRSSWQDIPLPCSSIEKPRFRSLRSALYELGAAVAHL